MVDSGCFHFKKESAEGENELFGLGEGVLLFFIFAFVLFSWEFGVKHEFILRNTNFESPAHVEMPR